MVTIFVVGWGEAQLSATIESNESIALVGLYKKLLIDWIWFVAISRSLLLLLLLLWLSSTAVSFDEQFELRSLVAVPVVAVRHCCHWWVVIMKLLLVFSLLSTMSLLAMNNLVVRDFGMYWDSWFDLVLMLVSDGNSLSNNTVGFEEESECCVLLVLRTAM